MVRKKLLVGTAVLGLMFSLAGCVPDANNSATVNDCDWDSPKLDMSSVTIPEGQEGELSEVVVGLWQLVPPNVLNGEEADPESDIRWGIPDTDTYMHCQNIGGDFKEFTQGFFVSDNEMFIVENIGDNPDNGYGMRYEVYSWNQDAIYFQGEFQNDPMLIIRR